MPFPSVIDWPAVHNCLITIIKSCFWCHFLQINCRCKRKCLADGGCLVGIHRCVSLKHFCIFHFTVVLRIIIRHRRHRHNSPIHRVHHHHCSMRNFIFFCFFRQNLLRLILDIAINRQNHIRSIFRRHSHIFITNRQRNIVNIFHRLQNPIRTRQLLIERLLHPILTVTILVYEAQ